MYIRRACSQLRHSRMKRDPDTEWTISPDLLVELYYAQGKRCALSGIELTWTRDGSGRKFPYNISIDRINPRLGYVSGNVQLVCTAVNMMKGTWSDATFITICEQVAKHMGSSSGQRKRAESFDANGDDTETGWRPSITD